MYTSGVEREVWPFLRRRRRPAHRAERSFEQGWIDSVGSRRRACATRRIGDGVLHTPYARLKNRSILFRIRTPRFTEMGGCIMRGSQAGRPSQLVPEVTL